MYKKNTHDTPCLQNRWRQFFRIMRLSILLVCLGVTCVSAHGLAQQITIKRQQLAFKELFKEIKKQTGYNYLWGATRVDKNSLVDVSLDHIDLRKALTLLLKDRSLEYEILDKTILIRESGGAETVSIQQEGFINGSVRDAMSRQPLLGVNVRIESGTFSKTIVSDQEGRFSVPVLPTGDYKIHLSYVGYNKVIKNIHVGTSGVTLAIDMLVAAIDMDNIVVIGYGSKAERDLTSAVSSIKGGELQQYANNALTFDNVLGGAVKGVLVTQSTGEPGSAAKLNIRGITSPVSGSTNEPLYVIDGVPFFSEGGALNPLLNIAVSDIESIDVLKDAAATAIYGSRGANGVVIVKTNRGLRNEKVSITAHVTHSVGNPIKTYSPLNTAQFKDIQDLLLRNTTTAINSGIARGTLDPFEVALVNLSGMETFGNMTPIAVDPISGVATAYRYDGLKNSAFGDANTNWVREVQNKNAQTSQFTVSARGGSQASNFAVSLNAADQEGLYINDGLKRFSGRIAVDSDLSTRMKAGALLNYSYSQKKSGTDIFFDGYTKAWGVRPDIPVFDGNGDYSGIDASVLYRMPVFTANPVAQHQNSNTDESFQFLGNTYLEYRILDHLKLRGDLNVASYQSQNRYFTPKRAQDDFSVFEETRSKLSVGHGRNTNTSVNIRAEYEREIDEHRFDLMAGMGWDRYFLNKSFAQYEDFPDDYVLNNISSAAIRAGAGETKVDRGLNAVYSRFSYAYKDKYLAEVNFRTDASSKFGPGRTRGYFPSASLGWRINKEAFLSGVEPINDLKLRLSWGNTGSTNIDDFLYRQFFSRTSYNLWGGQSAVLLDDVLPNKDVQWELTAEYNAGLDYAFFDHRLFGSFDVYHRETKGALGPSPAPLEAGTSNFYSNLIDMSNSGFELEVGYHIFRSPVFSWTSKFNISQNKNLIKKLNGATINQFEVDSFTEGEPAGSLKGYAVEKIFSNQTEIDALNAQAGLAGQNYYQEAGTSVGDFMFRDLNGDGIITTADRTMIASPEPKFFGGLYNSLTYKGLNLSFIFQFSQGAQGFLENLSRDTYGMLGQSVHTDLYGNTWTPENTDARYARLVAGDPNKNSRVSDRYVFETSFLRLKNINLTYNLPATLLRNKIQGAAVFFHASNVWTLSRWPGLDPELIGNTIPSSTVNNDPYPLSRAFSMGVQLTF